MINKPLRKRGIILIDDINYDPSPMYELPTIDTLPTFAILPDYANSVNAINILFGSNRELHIRLSMGPYNRMDEKIEERIAILASINEHQISEFF